MAGFKGTVGKVAKTIFGSKNDKEDGKKNDQGGENANALIQTTAEPVKHHHPSGLKVVATGTNPSIDIVAVHGLNGHREEAWMAKNGTSWLADETMLSKRIPNARIFVWGYDSNTHSKDYISRAYLHQHGAQLVGELTDERRLDGTTKRPIIFIGHSLGGIVIKSALIHSNAATMKHLPEQRAIKVSTYGVLFMGTPHSGGNGINLERVALNIASIFIHTNDSVLKHLEKQSEWLSQQKTQYAPICGDFVTKFGWESYDTSIPGGSKLLIVPHWSAVGWEYNAESIQIMADHVSMVKYTGDDDPEYAKVWKKLAIMAADAPKKVATNWQVEEGGFIVVELASSKAISEEERLELVSRLLYPAADMTDNKPSDKIHLTVAEPDVHYNPEEDAFKARSEHTLIGELTSIEETEAMREHQEALLKSSELYEKKVGDEDAKLSTGISMESHHNWDDVLMEAKTAQRKYKPREGWNSVPVLDATSIDIFETSQPDVELWLALLPRAPTSCASWLCGGLKMTLAIVWRSQTLSEGTLNALRQIPVTISRAQGFAARYDQATLAEHVAQLYCAILDMLRHILREYSRMSAPEQRVHFVEKADGFQLMRRYQRLLDLEKQVVIDQKVRIGALNSLKAMSEVRWDDVFAILNEQLSRKESYENALTMPERPSRDHTKTSVNADLYEALDYDHSLGDEDAKETLRHQFTFSAAEKSRVSWLVEIEALRDWITAPTAGLILINGNEPAHERTSPVSVYCGMLTRALQSQAPRIVLYWYCGLNVNEDAVGLLRNLIGQLLDHIETNKSPLKSVKKVWYAGLVPDDHAILFELFRKMLRQQLKTSSVFCVLDGVSFYEDRRRAQGLGDLVEDLAALVGDAERGKRIFKVLLTSPVRSEVVSDAADATNPGALEVVDMPSFVDVESSYLRDFEILSTSFSRRDSIGSTGSHSVYEDALDDLDYSDSD